MLPRDRIASGARARRQDKPAVPRSSRSSRRVTRSRREFLQVLRAVASAADAVEIGVPFSDPMADGVTIQRSSQHAIEHGVSLTWILDELARRDFELDFAGAADELSESAARVRLRRARAARGRGRRQRLHRAGSAVRGERAARCGARAARLGAGAARDAGDAGRALAPALRREPRVRLRRDAHRHHGRRVDAAAPIRRSYLAAVKAASSLPVCAGFGVRRADQVELLGAHADGVIVGSALVEVLERARRSRVCSCARCAPELMAGVERR